ncbi:MAG TPA: hypothetical protein DCX71_06210 [Erythrobacter sp.]|nr:hypothetical protein [Erythrobacter sp.]
MSKMGREAAVARCAIDGDTIKSRFDIPTPRGMNPVDTKIRAAGMTGVGPVADGRLQTRL